MTDSLLLNDTEFLARARGLCASKAAYVNREQATAMLRRLHYQGNPYKCAICGEWHVTTFDKRRSRQFAKRIRNLLRNS